VKPTSASILGSYETAHALPLVELDLSKLPKGMPKIASEDVKFEKDTEAYKLTKSAIAEDLDEEIVTSSTRSRSSPIAPSSFATMAALTCAYRARARFMSSKRIRIHGSPADRSLPWPRKKSGLSYSQMIGEIVDLAMARHT